MYIPASQTENIVVGAQAGPKILWEDMVIVEPHDSVAIPDAVLQVSPQFVERDVLAADQEAVYAELEAIAEVAEFMCFWGFNGWAVEFELETGDYSIASSG